MKRHIYTLKKLSALIILLVLGISANAQTYTPPNYSAGACAGGNTIESFYTGGGIYNINNSNSGCCGTSANVYYPSPATQGLWTRQGSTITVNIKNGHATNAQNYKVWVDFNDDGTYAATEQVYYGTIAANSTASGTFTVPMSASIATTRLRVRGGAGLTSSTDAVNPVLFTGEAEDYDVVILSNVIPDCDTVTNVQASNITLTGATLTWNPPAGGGATQYETHISTSSVPPTGSGFNPVSTPSLTVNNLTPSTCYYFHVRTDCDPLLTNTSVSDWVTYQFCTVQDCDQPKVTIDRITGTTAVATWDPVPTVYAYEYAVSTIAVPPVSGTVTTYTSVQMLGLAPNKGLYFHIRSLCSPTPQSLWKTVPFHTTVGTGVEEVNADNMMITAYPNPVQNKLRITLDGRIADKATVSMIDVTGKEVYHNVITGDMDVDMSGMPKGVYMLRYADGQSYKIIKIMKD
jgi:hypothetical protein